MTRTRLLGTIKTMTTPSYNPERDIARMTAHELTRVAAQAHSRATRAHARQFLDGGRNARCAYVTC